MFSLHAVYIEHGYYKDSLLDFKRIAYIRWKDRRELLLYAEIVKVW